MGMPIKEAMDLFNKEGDVPMEIMPNGEIRMEGGSPSNVRPSTVGNDMGGEYAFRQN